jgi:curved DNA-binding protein CbpA
MSDANEAFWQRVSALAQNLEALDYYALLGVPRDADADAISAAYYRRAPGTHPDRHTYERDPRRQRALTRLYARFGEAFRVLRAPELREAYDAALGRGETRLSREAQQRALTEAAGPDPKTPHARSLYDKAMDLLDADEPQAAQSQLRLAIQFERDSKAIARAIDRADNALADQSGDD